MYELCLSPVCDRSLSRIRVWWPYQSYVTVGLRAKFACHRNLSYVLSGFCTKFVWYWFLSCVTVGLIARFLCDQYLSYVNTGFFAKFLCDQYLSYVTTGLFTKFCVTSFVLWCRWFVRQGRCVLSVAAVVFCNSFEWRWFVFCIAGGWLSCSPLVFVFLLLLLTFTVYKCFFIVYLSSLCEKIQIRCVD